MLEQSNPLGPIGLICTSKSAVKAKKLSCDFEESQKIGRILDIDVFASNAKAISREKKRQCFLCSNPAFECMRAGTHSEKELRDFVDSLINEYLGAIER